MRRRLARPYGHTIPPARMLSLLMGLAVLGLLYQRVKEPQFWRWMTNESRADSADDLAEKKAAHLSMDKTSENGRIKEEPADRQENIVAGPNETDAEELARLRSNLKAVQDRQPLQAHEMPAYWQLLSWSRTRPFTELEKLSRRDVPYSHLWEEPDLYRGQPVRLKLHVRRVLHYDAPENKLGLKTIYEAWGWTDDSRSFPFVVVFPEKPAGLPTGTDVDGDIVFVGYFVKWMSYRAFDTKKNAPLFVGRAKPTARMVGGANKGGWESAFLMIVGGVLLISFLGWFALNALRRPKLVPITASVPEQLPENWLIGSPVAGSPETSTVCLDLAAPHQPASIETASSPAVHAESVPSPTASGQT